MPHEVDMFKQQQQMCYMHTAVGTGALCHLLLFCIPLGGCRCSQDDHSFIHSFIL